MQPSKICGSKKNDLTMRAVESSLDDSRASKVFTISYHEQLFSTTCFSGLPVKKTMRVLRRGDFGGIDLPEQKDLVLPDVRILLYGICLTSRIIGSKMYIID